MDETPGDIQSSLLGRMEEAYFDESGTGRGNSFDVRLLHQPVTVLSTRSPLIFQRTTSTSHVMRAMKAEHRGVVLITEDGTANSVLTGIFTERDVLLRVIDCGTHPLELPIAEVMSPDPEFLQSDARVAWVLNMMSVGGFRHVPVVNVHRHPVAVISVRDVVEYLVESFPSEILNLPPDFGASLDHPRDGA